VTAVTCKVRAAAISAKPAAVSVNGVAIPRDAIAREAQHHRAPTPLGAWKEAARALVVRELLLQEARRLGVRAEPLGDSGGRRETEAEASVRRLVEQEVLVPDPDDAACRRYYEQNRGRFRSPDICEAAHILIAAPAADRVAYERAREQATQLLAEVRANPAAFGDLAARLSDCPSTAQEGNLGQITPGQTTPEFEQALKAMTPGAICEQPVATRYGFHVVRLDRRIEGRELPFVAVAARIAEYLSESVRRRVVAQYIARLVSRAEIKGIDLAGAEIHRVR
jgi:peptidyl-prolyl cis-trans isomerase C